MAQATGRWGELIQTANNWLQAADRAAQKIRLCLRLAKWYGEDLGHPEYAQPYYAQIVALDPNNVGVLRQMGQLYRKNGNWQQLGATLTRALDVAVSDVDRKEILTELGELLESHMSQTDQALELLQARARGRRLFIPALEDLERIYAERGENERARRHPHAQGRARSTSPRRSRRPSCASAGSTRRAAATRTRAAQVVPRGPRASSRSNLQGLRGLARVYEVLNAVAGARRASSRRSSTSSRPSASASTS